jgi:hypothetical protein
VTVIPQEVSTSDQTDYVPSHVSKTSWLAVEGVVKSAVALATTSQSNARRYASHLAPYAAWANGQGVEPETTALLDPDLIERYIQVGMPDAADSTRATRRAILRRIAHRVSPTLSQLPAPEAMAYRKVRPPLHAA